MLITPQMSGLKLEALAFFFSKRTSLFPKQNPSQMLSIKQIQHRCCDGVGWGARLSSKTQGDGSSDTSWGAVLWRDPWKPRGREDRCIRRGQSLISGLLSSPRWCWGPAGSDRRGWELGGEGGTLARAGEWSHREGILKLLLSFWVVSHEFKLKPAGGHVLSLLFLPLLPSKTWQIFGFCCLWACT